MFLRKPNKYRPEYHPKNEYADNENNPADFYPHIEEQQRQRNCVKGQSQQKQLYIKDGSGGVNGTAPTVTQRIRLK